MTNIFKAFFSDDFIVAERGVAPWAFREVCGLSLEGPG